MLKIWDTECKECGQVIEQAVEENEQFSKCPVCGGKMVKIFTTMNFKLIYDNKKDICSWGDWGYQTSQYWKDVKAAREQGYDVKGAGED